MSYSSRGEERGDRQLVEGRAKVMRRAITAVIYSGSRSATKTNDKYGQCFMDSAIMKSGLNENIKNDANRRSDDNSAGGEKRMKCPLPAQEKNEINRNKSFFGCYLMSF